MKQLSVILICFIVTSCSIPVTISLFNNSGIDQIVSIGDKSIKINRGDSEYIDDIEYSEFSASSEGESRTYSAPSIPVSSIVWRGWGPFSKRMFYLQLQPDEKIWVSKSKSRVTDFGDQPEGFPLAPNT